MDHVAQTTPAREIHHELGHHMLVDGYDIVLDLEKSHGCFLHDAKTGREILDFFGSFSTVAVGYNHPRLTGEDFTREVLPAAINKPANSDLYTAQMHRFVENLSRTIPASLNKHLFFIEGGALAVENTLKTAFDWKRRKNLAAGREALGSKILHFKDAFHGRSGYTMSLTNTDPTKTDYFPNFDWPRLENPKLSFPVTDDVVREVQQAEARCVQQIEQALAENSHEIAGLIIEPIQGEGGDNHFRPEFLQTLRRLADDHEFLLIFDEVQTGFATTGKWWSFEHFDVEPDLFAFGKKTQVCGIAASSRIDDIDSVFAVSSRINSTWGGNLVDMVRCAHIVEIVEEEGLLANATYIGQFLTDGLRRLAGEFTEIQNVRGLGLFLAFDLPDAETRQRVLAAMFDEQLLGLASGSRSIRFRPPLILTEDIAQDGLRRTARALERVLR